MIDSPPVSWKRPPLGPLEHLAKHNLVQGNPQCCGSLGVKTTSLSTELLHEAPTHRLQARPKPAEAAQEIGGQAKISL